MFRTLFLLVSCLLVSVSAQGYEAFTTGAAAGFAGTTVSRVLVYHYQSGNYDNTGVIATMSQVVRGAAVTFEVHMHMSPAYEGANAFNWPLDTHPVQMSIYYNGAREQFIIDPATNVNVFNNNQMLAVKAILGAVGANALVRGGAAHPIAPAVALTTLSAAFDAHATQTALRQARAAAKAKMAADAAAAEAKKNQNNKKGGGGGGGGNMFAALQGKLLIQTQDKQQHHMLRAAFHARRHQQYQQQQEQVQAA